MLNADTLKTELKDDLEGLFTAATNGDGLTPADYADKLAGIIASRVTAHIAANAEVAITTGQPIPPDPGVTPAWKGTVS